jgi:hypothetical protein
VTKGGGERVTKCGGQIKNRLNWILNTDFIFILFARRETTPPAVFRFHPKTMKFISEF